MTFTQEALLWTMALLGALPLLAWLLEALILWNESLFESDDREE
jgi:hypothetical protein